MLDHDCSIIQQGVLHVGVLMGIQMSDSPSVLCCKSLDHEHGIAQFPAKKHFIQQLSELLSGSHYICDLQGTYRSALPVSETTNIKYSKWDFYLSAHSKSGCMSHTFQAACNQSNVRHYLQNRRLNLGLLYMTSYL